MSTKKEPKKQPEQRVQKSRKLPSGLASIKEEDEQTAQHAADFKKMSDIFKQKVAEATVAASAPTHPAQVPPALTADSGTSIEKLPQVN